MNRLEGLMVRVFEYCTISQYRHVNSRDIIESAAHQNGSPTGRAYVYLVMQLKLTGFELNNQLTDYIQHWLFIRSLCLYIGPIYMYDY